MFTTTEERRELFATSPIDEQPLPTDYDSVSGKDKDDAHALAVLNKKIRLLDDKEMEVKDVLNFRDKKTIEAIRANERIPERKYLNVPFAKRNNRKAA